MLRVVHDRRKCKDKKSAAINKHIDWEITKPALTVVSCFIVSFFFFFSKVFASFVRVLAIVTPFSVFNFRMAGPYFHYSYVERP